MISKELFEAVTNIKSDRLFYSSDGYVSTDMAGTENKINIYELAHKCKEWAIKNDFFIFSGYNGNYNCFVNHSGNRFFGDTESEAIFKACQWILDNKED